MWHIFQLLEDVRIIIQILKQNGLHVCFPGEGLSHAVVEELELTRCIEDVYKVRTTKTSTKHRND